MKVALDLEWLGPKQETHKQSQESLLNS